MAIDTKGIYHHPPMKRTSKRRPHVPMKAHIMVGCRYIYKQLNWQPELPWLKTGDEVICKDTLPDLPMHVEIETLDQKHSGEVHVISLRLAGDFSRK